MSQGVAPQAVVGPVADLLGLDEPCPAHRPQVVADERLGDPKFLHKVADAQLLDGEQLDDAPSERLAESAQPFTHARI